ncbi:hypothetical protein HW532_12635 [Kaustia mangrovi]|uniref:Uncharacterized protein n=1 Tax=Kaustia mangrovi TaxID=2593653 RepID=A0A7S8C4X9_9HYPH|nr:hypothetical protein [Kaustia mangrovi]QPC43464.1 hypothetical protein HW532_12635 [Kaustia mangrovi]
MNKLAPFLAIICTLNITTINIIEAKEYESKTIALSIRFHDKIDSYPEPLIYVKGSLRGSVPGAIELSVSKEEIPIEIGISQFPLSPLYSFTISLKTIRDGYVDVISTNIASVEGESNRFWDTFKVLDNSSAQEKITKISNKIYEIKIPTSTYRLITQKWQNEKINYYSPAWFGAGISKFQNSSEMSHFMHKIPGSNVAASWSGAIGRTGTGIQQRHNWIIESVPDGAYVSTDEDRNIGNTNIQHNIAHLPGSYILVKKSGYYDAQYNCVANPNCRKTEFCTETRIDDDYRLVCHLKKLP